MQKMTLIARLVLGFIFFASGLVGLFNLAPPPTDIPADLQTYTEGLMASRYFFPLLKITELTCGLLLLTELFVPVALVVLAPIILNIFMTHLFLAPSGLPLAIFVGILEIYLAFYALPYRRPIRALFIRRLS